MRFSLNSCTAIILAGGRGTRSANPRVPKISQSINGVSQLEYHYQLLEKSAIRNVLLVAGHLGEQVADLANTVDTILEVDVLQEPEQNGTVAALKFASQHSDNDQFLVLLGDILCSFNIDRFLQHWRTSNKPVAVIAHPSLHPEDSDVAFPTSSGEVIVRSKNEEKVGIPNMSSTGIFALTRKGINKYSHLADIGSDVLREAAGNNDLFCWVDSNYFKDLGTPDRLAAGIRDVSEGIFRRRGNTDSRSAIFLDRDGVINPALPEVYTPDQFNLLPGVSKEIASINSAGIPVFVITNQPGIAKGFMDDKTHQAIQAAMDKALSQSEAFCDEYLYCPHHPEKGFIGEVPELKILCSCRKPTTGLVEDVRTRHGIDLSTSVMVGDTSRDMEMAAAAGISFIHVSNQNCQIQESHFCVENSADAISKARETVLRC